MTSVCFVCCSLRLMITELPSHGEKLVFGPIYIECSRILACHGGNLKSMRIRVKHVIIIDPAPASLRPCAPLLSAMAVTFW